MQYTNEELKEILDKHMEWLKGNKGGEHANLRGADLCDANLRGAYLRDAYLSGAYLRDAYLSKTILESINWLSYIGIVPDSKGWARAYKVTTKEGQGVYQGGINYTRTKTFKANLNTNTSEQCAPGVNLATFAWCLNEKQEGRRLFLLKFKTTPDNICVPIGTDGKFRVSKAHMVGECNWQGNLIVKRG